MIRRVVFASFLVAGFAAQSHHPTQAQAVYPSPQAPPIPTPDRADVPPPPPKPAEVSRSPERRTVAQANPPARRTSNTSDYRADSLATPGRFANPGGVGRYAEYYTSNTPTSQADLHPTHPTRFDRGAGPDRASQIASFRAGQQRTANIQNNINAYGRPYGAYGAGFGFGFGLATGGLYGGGFR